MRLPIYQYVTESNSELFRFDSIGPKGVIKKLVMFTPMFVPNMFNLAFGDFDVETNMIDDTLVSDNNDSTKVLATVAATITDFAIHHPLCWIYATGSTPARTRLYQMGIAAHLQHINEQFELYGLQQDNWRLFEKGKNYEAFLVRSKFM